MIEIELGMPADEVLTLPGYTKRDAVRPPEQIGEDEYGLVVKWFYPDKSVTFRRYRHEGGSSYRVSMIEPTMSHFLSEPTVCEWVPE